MAEEKPVYRVEEVSVELQKTKPPVFVVRAKGQTRTVGWGDASLSRAIYIDPPSDGIQDYEFVAVPPSGGAAEVITDIDAEDRWEDCPDWLRGARVKAEENEVQKDL